MFDTTKEDLKDLLKEVDTGEIQLPDFQRNYVWNDDDVRSLLASVSKGYPIGALLMLEGGSAVNFKPRLLEGVPHKNVMPDSLLLDGQQRITSLYQTMFSQSPVKTIDDKKKEIERFYYIDMKVAVGGKSGAEEADIFEAIVPVWPDKKIRANFGRDVVKDLSLAEGEYAHHLFPFNRVFRSKDWFYGWKDYWKERGEDHYSLERAFDSKVLEHLERYKVPIIRLDKENSREAICLVFEKVNVGGKKLDAFELVTAIYAADKFDLREDWGNKSSGRLGRIIGAKNRRDVLAALASTEFLQACSLVHTRENREQRKKVDPNGELPQISCKRESLLALPLFAYRNFANTLEAGFVEAGAFLNEQKIIWNRDIPYPPLIVALASVFAILGTAGATAAAKKKLERWFWSVTFGELYGSATESRLARDVPELVDWIKGTGEAPRSVDEALFQKERLDTLRSRQSAAYKGIHSRLMFDGCRDFISGKPADIMTFDNAKIDIHHIFPKKWCKDNGIKMRTLNSIVNKTALSKRSNIAIGGHAPSIYLKKIEEKHGIASSDLDEILRSHLIEPRYLRSDDFENFFRDRRDRLALLVERAMDKKVVAGFAEDGVDLEPDNDDEENDANADQDSEVEQA
jgi:hypothetical protein